MKVILERRIRGLFRGLAVVAGGCAFCFSFALLAQEGTGSEISVIGKEFSCSVEPDVSRVVCKALNGYSFSQVESFSLEDPYRLVVDITGASLGKFVTRLVVGSSIVHRIRGAQKGQVVRVVLDLKKAAVFSRYDSPDKSLISFDLAPIEQSLSSPERAVAAPTELAQPSPRIPTPRPQQQAPSLPAPLGPVDVSLSKKALDPDGILQFSVSSTFVSFEPGDRPVRDLKIINKTNGELFLRSDVQRVYDSGTVAERYENTKNVVASPRRFSIPPLGTRTIRLFLAGEPPQAGEEMYRLIVSPEERPDAGVSVEGELNDQPATFKVVAGLGVTIALPSAGARGLVSIEPKRNQVVLTNNGSRAVVVESCSACPLNSDSCRSTDRKLLHPQRSWSVPVFGNGVITCDVTMGNEQQQLSSMFNNKEPN